MNEIASAVAEQLRNTSVTAFCFGEATCHDYGNARSGRGHLARLKFEVHLPGLVVGVDDIKMTGLRRWFSRGKPAGPYLIISRASGMALDTGGQYDHGHVLAGSPNSFPHQLWYLRPSGIQDEATIISAANGLALDATVPTTGDIHPLMWEPNEEPWQRWRLEPAPDGIGFLIKSPHNGNYLTLSQEAHWHTDDKWMPWFSPRQAEHSQQWIFSLPYGNI